MKRRTTLHSHPDEEATINLTPLIDVVFVVLIIFILIAPMLQVDMIKLAQGNPETEKIACVQEVSPITIRVLENNTIWINQHQIDKELLLKTLKTLKQHYPKAVPQVIHDKKAYFETYQTIKNALEQSGFEEMDIILQPR